MAFNKAGKRDYGDRGPRTSRGGRDGGRSFGRKLGGRGGGLQLHDVTCAECGKATQVPFKPTGEKPVLCRDCFKGDSGGSRDSGKDYSEDLRAINEKLDKIIEALDLE